MNLINLAGQRFGRLRVISRAPDLVCKTKRFTQWNCICDCGKEKVVYRGHLLRGVIVSCGCYGIQRTKETFSKSPGESARNIVIRAYKRHAKRRGLSWTISDSEFLSLASRNCFYCDSEPSNSIKNSGGEFRYNGIDRMDNSKGYDLANVQPCCKRCNAAKSDMTFEQFLGWAKRVVRKFSA